MSQVEIIRRGKGAQILPCSVLLHSIPRAKALCEPAVRHTSKENEAQIKGLLFSLSPMSIVYLDINIYASPCSDFPLFSRNQMPPKYISGETQPEGETSRLSPQRVRFSTRTFSSSVLYDTWSNVALRELTHCPKA